MRHIYLTLQSRDIIPELLEGNAAAVRPKFRNLLDEEALALLLEGGAGAIGPYEREELTPRRARLPFIPWLGQLRISDKAQVEHRAFGHDYGRGTFPQSLPASPTGIRLMPKTHELRSRHQLADTYSSASNQELSRRIASEGATDYFVSHDQSTWHLAISIQPRQRITVRPLTEQATSLARHARIAVRPYIHVYPYGGLTVTLCFSLLFDVDTAADRVIELLRPLARSPSDRAFGLAMRGVEAGSTHEFVAKLARMTKRAIVPAAQVHDDYVHLDYALSVGTSEAELTDAELAGLLTLDERYEGFKPSWVESRASLYGKFSGDRVVASRSSLAVCTDPAQFSPSARRRFFWRCHALKELAGLQGYVLWWVARGLAAVGTADGPDEAATARLVSIGEHLIDFPRGLPAHHRKWFYERQGGVGATDAFLDALAGLHRGAEHAAIIMRIEKQRDINIHLNDSQVGVLNLGSVVGSVQAHLAVVAGPDADEVRRALEALARAVIDEEALPDERRQQLLESIDLLAQEAGVAPAQRRGSVIRTVLSGLAASLAGAASLAEVWSAVGPSLLHFFGG
jgi:hypothetical protein